MKLKFQLTEEDLIAFQIFFVGRSNIFRRTRLKHRLRVPIVYTILAIILACQNKFWPAAFFVLVGSVWFIKSPAANARHSENMNRTFVLENIGDSLSEPEELEFLPDGIRQKNYFGESLYRYASIDRIAENGIYTYLFLGKMRALILPSDRIPAEQIESVVKLVRQKLPQADPA
jgi:YcxB-like protein